MTQEQNNTARARCCLSDLRFLLSILPENSGRRMEVQALIGQIENLPTDDQINAAWIIVAIIHEKIRKSET